MIDLVFVPKYYDTTCIQLDPRDKHDCNTLSICTVLYTYHTIALALNIMQLQLEYS